MQLDFEKNEVKKRIDSVVRRTMAMDLLWDWPCGVAYFGVARAWRATGNREYFDLLKMRVDTLIALGLPQQWTVNACAMGHCLLDLYEETKCETYLDIIQSKLAYLTKEAPRFGDGVLQHTVSIKDDFPEQCWADTLFMAALFLLRAGVLKNEKSLIEDALNQYFWHIEYLMDQTSGLFYHGYSHVSKTHLSGFFWGRANAWAALTMAQVSEILPECYLYPRYMDIAGALNEQMSALKMCQTEQGLWRTLLNDDQSYEETSASAGIVCAMVMRNNVLYTAHINRAIQGIIAQIEPTGRVQNVSAGTAIMQTREGYCNISKRWMQGWGQGLVLAFLAELLRENAESDGAL